MVFVKKIFSQVVVFMKTFSHVVIHGYKNTIGHKNMTYMIVWLEMVINHICFSHKCQVLV